MYRLLSIPVAAAALLASACLDTGVEDPPFPPMCEETSDCADGKTCDVGVCWGDPPSSAGFAAVLVPPSGREDLVRTDIARLDIADDGFIGDLSFGPTITVSGRVRVACDANADPTFCDPTRTIGAQIKFVRPSVVDGGPDYGRTITAEADLEQSELSFSVDLPRLADGDAPYEVTVTPAVVLDGAVPATNPAELAPPVRFTLDGDRDQQDLDWILGEPEEHKIVVGRIVDAADRGIEMMQVFARGRWSADDELVRASSVSFTDANGVFALRIPIEMLDFYELVAVPASSTVKPTLRATELYIPDPEVIQSPDNTVFIDDLRMPSHPEAATFVLPIAGADTAGAEEPVAGAEVTLQTVLLEDGTVTATYTASGVTDINGDVELELIPGGSENRIYLARIVPPPSASHATLDQKAISVGSGTAGARSFLSKIQLGSRSLVVGTVTNADGEPVAGATVSPRASTAFKLGQSLPLQADLDTLPFPSVTTDASGAFKLWLDPLLFGVLAHYDLEVVPPAGAVSPRWSLTDRSVEALSPEGGLEIQLPPPSFARGVVVDQTGESVPGAELWLFQLSDDGEICQNANLPAGDDCVPPAILRGVWQSRQDGVIWVILPDIDAVGSP